MSAILAGLALAAAAPAEAPLRMTCHELLGGQPMREAIIYELVGPNLFRTSPEGERIIISSAGDRRYLSTVRDRGVDVLTYAEHVRRGSVLERRVWEQRRGGPMRLRFTERLDFAAQRYTSSFSGGADQCRHDAFGGR